MKINIKNALSNVEYFWATQKNNFYFGMVLCMLFILNIPMQLPSLPLILLSPVLSTAVYLLVWLFNYKFKPEKWGMLKSAGMTLLGGLWTMLFALI